jgi:hypothetical protein
MGKPHGTAKSQRHGARSKIVGDFNTKLKNGRGKRLGGGRR